MKKTAILITLFAASFASARPQNANTKITSVLSEKKGSQIFIKVSAQELCSEFPSITSGVRALNEKALAVTVNLFDSCVPKQIGDKEKEFLLYIDSAAEAAGLGLTTPTPEVYVQVQ